MPFVAILRYLEKQKHNGKKRRKSGLEKDRRHQSLKKGRKGGKGIDENGLNREIEKQRKMIDSFIVSQKLPLQ